MRLREFPPDEESLAFLVASNKMSRVLVQLCAKLLLEHFGPVVEKIATYLMQHESVALRAIIRDVKEPLSNIKKSLKVLVHHHFVEVIRKETGWIEYCINLERIVLILRYPKYIYVAKILYGDVGEHIIEELLKDGQLTISTTIQRVVDRLSSALSLEEVRRLPRSVYDAFVKMFHDGFVEKSWDVSSQSLEEQLNPKSDDIRDVSNGVPEVKLNLITIGEEADVSAPTPKRAKINNSQPDAGIYWRVNIYRFHHHLRDILVMDAIKAHYDDEKALEIAKVILEQTQSKLDYSTKCTPGVSKQVITDSALKSSLFENAPEVDMYLTMLNDDVNNRFICKYEASAGGGTYGINLTKVLERLFDYSVASVIEGQYGAKMSRIFRLILSKKYMQQKQIEDCAMLPSKDCKEMTYILFREGFVKTLQYPRQPDYAPSRTFFVFTADRFDLARKVMQNCYKAFMNSIIRRNHEHEQNKSLLDRKIIIDAVIASLRNQSDAQDVERQIEDLNQSFSTHEKELLRKLQKITSKLEMCESQIDETMFVMQTWLALNS